MCQEWKIIACPHDCPGGCIMEARYHASSDTLQIRHLEKDLGVDSFCPKGLRWLKRRKHPERICTPLLRGEESFYPISWQRAWDLWASALEEGLQRGGPLSNAFYQSAGSLYFSKNLLPSLHGALGGYTTSRGNLCSSAGNQGLKNCFGQVPVLPRETLLREGKSLLLWGRNILENHRSLAPLGGELRRRGGSIGILEIRSTPTVSWADGYWHVAPGGDCFLAAWLCQRLLRENQVFPEWFRRVVNAEEFTAFLETLGEEDLLAAGGISRKEALSLYGWLLESAPVAHCLGYGMQRYLHGEMQSWWVSALAVLLGAFEAPGCGVFFGKDEMARFPSSLLEEPPSKRSFPESQFWNALSQASPPVHTLGVFCANPVKQAPGGNHIAHVIQSLPFSVCLDVTLTETARCCSLILPSAFFFEEGPDWRGSYGHSLLCRTEKIAPPPGECLGDLAILQGLGKTLGLSLDLQELRNSMDSLLLEYKDMERIYPSVYAWKEANFWEKSSSFATLPLKLPASHALEEPEKPRKLPELRLVTYHVEAYINGQNWDLSEKEVLPVSLSQEDARRLGFSPGERVLLWNSQNPRGISGEVRVDSRMGSGYCAVPQGSPLVNSLTLPLVSPGYGVPFSESFIRIEKER